jgi:hypothetical protein
VVVQLLADAIDDVEAVIHPQADTQGHHRQGVDVHADALPGHVAEGQGVGEQHRHHEEHACHGGAVGDHAAHHQHQQGQGDGLDLAGQDHFIHRRQHADQPPGEEKFRLIQLVVGHVFLDPGDGRADGLALVIAEEQGHRAVLGLGVGKAVHVAGVGAGDEHVNQLAVLVGIAAQFLVAGIAFTHHALHRRQDVGQGDAAAHFRLGFHVLLEALHALKHAGLLEGALLLARHHHEHAVGALELLVDGARVLVVGRVRPQDR